MDNYSGAIDHIDQSLLQTNKYTTSFNLSITNGVASLVNKAGTIMSIPSYL